MSISITIIHAVLFIFLIIELGLTGYSVDRTSSARFSAPSSFAFMLFNSIWSLIIMLYISLTTLGYLERFRHGLVVFGLLALTTLFWFAGSIAMAVYIGVPECHGNIACSTIQAAVAFGFFIWAIFAGLAVLEGMASLGGRARVDKATPNPA